MPDVDKLFEKAEKYLKKQKFESALETYLQIHKHTPNDEEVLVNLGDLFLKLNRPADALRFQSLLVDQYVKRNDVPKALATCRQILKSSPQDVSTMTKMAGLLERSQQNGEALKAYRGVLELHRASGDTHPVLDCLQHIARLDPTDLDAHVELGELAGRLHDFKMATPAFLKAAQLARAAEQEDRWAELVERAHSLDPRDEAASIAAAELFLKKGKSAEAVSLLEPIVRHKPDDLAVLELLAKGYLKTGDTAKADPLCWKLYQARPETIGLVLELADQLLQTDQADKALNLVGRLKDRLFQRNRQNEFLKIMEKIYAADESNLQVLEILTSVYNELNHEDGLRRSLTRLFNLYLAGEQYGEAADTLERILDVDPYGEGHDDRLLNLEGHIDSVLYKNILSRIEPSPGGRAVTVAATGAGTAATQEAELLEDFIVEGEMYHHYLLTAKLRETLEKINRLYPGAEEGNSRLRDLYDAAGFRPKSAPGGPPSPSVSPAPPPKVEAPRPQAAAPSLQSLEDLRKTSEITANIYRESTPQGVTQVAANEIARALNASRCWGALGTPDRPPALTVEYCSPAFPPSDITAVLKLYSALIRQASTNPDGWSIEDVEQFSILTSVLPEIHKLGIKSLLALPLADREGPAGLLLVEQCDQRRAWTAGDAVLVKAIATQVVVAVNNAKLRRLVRSLSGSDEETGLFPRSAYLDCLLAEAQRAKELSKPLSVCLLEPENPSALLKALGDAGFQGYFRRICKALQSNLRQNDVTVRYSPCSVAVVFPDTALLQGGLAVEKLRRVISQVKLDGAPVPIFCGAVCDAQLGPNFGAVDGVTEVINRLEAALEQAHKEGGKRVLVSKFED